MDNFALSIHVRSTDTTAVTEALREMHTLMEYEPAEGEITMDEFFTARPRREGIRISQARDGWVSVLLSGGAVCTNILARALSKWLQTTVLEIEGAGDDLCAFMLVHNGEVVDQYRLAPETEDDNGGGESPLDPESLLRGLPSPGLLGLHPDLEQLQTNAMALMTPEMQRIFERVSDGTATPAEDRKLERWVAENVEALTGLFIAPIQEAMPEIEWVEQLLGVDDYDDDEPESEDLQDVISIEDYFGPGAYLKYYEPLVAPGVDPEDVDDLLGKEDIAPHELLPAFLSMLGIAPIYARLDYPFVPDVPGAELAEAGVEFVEHLKFRLADDE